MPTMMFREKTRQRSLRLSTLVGTLVTVVLLIGTSGTAQAVSGTWEVFLENCASCFGSTYKLEVTEGATSGGFTNYDVTYTIDTTNYTGGGVRGGFL